MSAFGDVASPWRRIGIDDVEAADPGRLVGFSVEVEPSSVALAAAPGVEEQNESANAA
jgi:hypothetical protein